MIFFYNEGFKELKNDLHGPLPSRTDEEKYRDQAGCNGALGPSKTNLLRIRYDIGILLYVGIM
jgi:hypothetical protein